MEPEIIKALYRASGAGVAIDLIVRGACSLKPGVPGVSDNIRVRSIIGRFLEHPRVFYFGSGGEPEVWLSSADWMERNFFRRVEVCFPVDSKPLQKRMWQDLQLYLEDNAQAWLLQRDGNYSRESPAEGESLISAQQKLPM